MATVTPKLEFSTSPLSVSNAAATWIDVTQYCRGASWSSGVNREFDDPQAGTATFILKNLQRRFEPEYAAGAYYPNIVPGRRFRWSVDGVQQGIWYAQSWQVYYPDRSQPYSEVQVDCTDGFWRLALNRLGPLTPPSAETMQDVIMDETPVAYYPLDEAAGNALNAVTGPSGTYRGSVGHATPNPVAGDSNPAAIFKNSYGRAKMDDLNIFTDAQAFTVEGTADTTGGANTSIAMGPFKSAPVNDCIFGLQTFQAFFYYNGGTQVLASAAAPSAGVHHFAMTYDGSVLTFYQDGVAVAATPPSTAGNLATPDSGEFIYVAGGSVAGGVGPSNPLILSHVAFYNYALTPAQISSHSNAALNLGYRQATSGTRIASLATDSLWSTAGITAGTVTAAARFKNGQTAIDEITETAKIEQPGSLFYFDDAGNPDNRSLQDAHTVAATFGDTPAEINYDSVTLTYNDEVFNSSTISGEGLAGSTAQNTTSQSDYGLRAQDNTSLILAKQTDTALLSQAIVDQFSTPRYRFDTISINGSTAAQRTQLLTREVGDTIRVKRRGEGGTAVDVITRILAKEKTLTVDGDLRCTWTLARGFNAADAHWRLNVDGYDELGTNTVLG